MSVCVFKGGVFVVHAQETHLILKSQYFADLYDLFSYHIYTLRRTWQANKHANIYFPTIAGTH